MNAPHSLTPSLRILVAEDHPVNQKLAVALLSKRGHEVVVAADGRIALEAWEHQRFDVILMDVHMPNMGGIEATQAIREREKSRGGHVRIIALTALAMTSDRDRCLSAGMDGYVSKPLDANDLFATLERLLPRRPSPGSAVAASGAVPPVDASRLLATVEGDHVMMLDILETFVQDCPAQEAAIAEALARRDAPALARAAHGFKGVLITMAAMPAADAARRVEMLARASRLEEAPGAIAELRQEIRRLEPALRDLAQRRAA